MTGDQRPTVDEDPIEAYLDDLADRLPLRGRRLRRVLAEVDDHLVTARAAAARDGLDDDAAGRRAITEFGSSDVVAKQLSQHGASLSAPLMTQGLLSLMLVAGIGLIAVGVSGLLAWGAGTAFGKPFVSGDTSGITYTTQRCADFHALAPREPTCTAAAIAHHYVEVVGYRLYAGVLGLLVLGVWLAIVRPWRGRTTHEPTSYDVLPVGFVATVGAALFGAAAVVTLPGGLLELAFGGTDNGAGALLSAGVVATLVFAAFALSLWRSLSARLA